jgi:Glycosyltransferase family 87
MAGKAAGAWPSTLIANRWFLTVLGVLLLAACAWWWKATLHRNQWPGGQRSWVPPAHILSVDFLSNYQAAPFWVNGGNPYREDFGDPLKRPYTYSPICLVLFSWCSFFKVRQAVLVWTVALAVMAAAAAFVCWRHRQKLDLWSLPLPFLLATVLCSTPVLFEMERGNCDLVVLMLLACAAWALAKEGLVGDILAGTCAAAATWMKIYPGLLGLGLLVIRRPRALACLLAAYLAIGAADYKDTLQSIASIRAYVRDYDIPVHASAHPFGTYWKHLWEGSRLAFLNKLPGTVAATATLLPVVLWVSMHVHRCRNRRFVLFPYFAWLTAVATFLPPVSNDYNLFFLPIAALAVWDRRDPVLVHVLMAMLLLWWQPVRLPIGETLVFVFKLFGVIAVGMSLTQRCQEQAQMAVGATAQEEAPSTPVLAAAA